MNKQEFKEFLLSDIIEEIIENNDYNELYWRFNAEIDDGYDVMQLTEFLYGVGINPLDYFKIYVPAYFMCGLDASKINIGEKIIIPGKLRRINPKAFSALKGIDTIILEEGIEDLEAGSFSANFELRHVFLPSTIKSISISAFNQSSGIDIFYRGPRSEIHKLFSAVVANPVQTIYYLENNEWVKY